MTHPEHHRVHRVGWLRAAVLGANDGIVSTASLIVGFAASGTSQETIAFAGLAGLVAGAMSMAAGEYVSVSSQADTEAADLAIETRALRENFSGERDELAQIYQTRGLDADLARQVADQLMAHDALGAHARDEIGISSQISANPVEAAVSSGLTFTVGAGLPLGVSWIAAGPYLLYAVALSSLLFLALLGALAARAGGASIWRGATRVTFWGTAAMLITAAVGHLFGVSA